MVGQRLRERVASRRVIIADGALGTELHKVGLPSGVPPELWNEQRPYAVSAVHRSYVEAGSELLLTNSFGANPVKLERLGLEREAATLSVQAARLCVEAAEGLFVLGSIGPTGRLLKPWGELTECKAVQAFSLQASALAEGGVDGLILETFYSLTELEIALEQVLKETTLPVGCSMSFDARGNTIMGEPVEALLGLAHQVNRERLLFVGANCSVGPEGMDELCRRLCRAAEVPVWVKPNAGTPQLGEQGTAYPTSPKEFSQRALAWVNIGARVVGGCCGTTPAHIRCVAEVLR